MPPYYQLLQPWAIFQCEERNGQDLCDRKKPAHIAYSGNGMGHDFPGISKIHQTDAEDQDQVADAEPVIAEIYEKTDADCGQKGCPDEQVVGEEVARLE